MASCNYCERQKVSNEEHDRINELRAQGRTYPEIQAQLESEFGHSRTTSTINNHVEDYRLHPRAEYFRPVSKEEHERMNELRAQGHTLSEIADKVSEEFNSSRDKTLVSNHLKREFDSFRKPPTATVFSAEELYEIDLLLSQNVPVSKIPFRLKEKFGIERSESSIRGKLRTAKLNQSIIDERELDDESASIEEFK